MPRIVSLGVMLGLIIVLGIMFFQVIAPFLLPLFLAGITAVICQPVFRFYMQRTKDRIHWAAGLTTATFMAALLIPLSVIVLVASLQLYTFASNLADSPRWKESVTQTRDRARAHSENALERTIGIVNQFLPAEQHRTPEDLIGEIRENLKQSLQGLGDRSLGDAASVTFGVLADAMGTLVALLIGLLIYTMALYYFLADGPNLTSAAERLIPVHAEYQRQLLSQFSKVVRSVVVATFLAAFGQGLATAVALKLFGFPHAFVLFILATLASLIPIVGAWLVWLPCVIVLFIDGHWIQATFLFLYGSMFVGMLDNVIRTYVLNTDTRLHPLLAFISILGGMQVMGLWGVFIGPIVASCLHALIQIFNVELKEFSKEQQQTEPAQSNQSATNSTSKPPSSG